MSEPFLGQISIYAFGFAPRGFAFCNGQIMAITQNLALFSLLGTTYGGNGQTTFALPNMKGNIALSSGQGPGLSAYALGQASGEGAHTLTLTEMPLHFHPVRFATDTTETSPAMHYWAQDTAGNVTFATTDGVTLSPAAITSQGSGQAHQNMEPYLTLNFCIALQGVFPSRD
jgi:microcystin-dependent protein